MAQATVAGSSSDEVGADQALLLPFAIKCIKRKNLETALGCADGSNVFCTGCRAYLLASVGLGPQSAAAKAGEKSARKTREATMPRQRHRYKSIAGTIPSVQGDDPLHRSEGSV